MGELNEVEPNNRAVIRWGLYTERASEVECTHLPISKPSCTDCSSREGLLTLNAPRFCAQSRAPPAGYALPFASWIQRTHLVVLISFLSLEAKFEPDKGLASFPPEMPPQTLQLVGII